MYTILVFLAVLVVLVLTHEFGHFIVARLSGMRVYEFGFGFPPRLGGLAKINGKWRFFGPKTNWEDPSAATLGAGSAPEGTIYTLNLLPLGGFVRIKGENGDAPDARDSDSFSSKKNGRKFAVLVAGVVMNVLTAFVLLSGAYMYGVPESVSSSVAKNVPNHHVQILEVTTGSAGAAAGMMPGDQVFVIGDQVNPTTDEFRAYVQAHGTDLIPLTIQRRGKEVRVAVRPIMSATEKRPIIGVAIADVAVRKLGFFEAIAQGAKTTGVFIREIIFGLGKLVASLFGGPSVAGEVAGPVGVAVMTGQAARLGLVYLAQFAAVLSLNLAVLNVLPIPALDGGRLFFVIINAFKKKPVSARIEQIIHSVTFALLILLVVVITVKDIGGLLGPIGTWRRFL